MGTRFALWMMRWLAHWPLPWVRALGWLFGQVLCVVVVPRRRVVQTNLHLCFPTLNKAQISALSRKVFVHFAQAWLDRAWIWYGSEVMLRNRLTLTGAVDELDGNQPTVIFAPHFVGLDAGWTALTQQLPRHFTTIYTHQSNPVSDAWILQGRERFGSARLFGRADGIQTIVSSLRQGNVLYLLPDMDFGPKESLFVPFYGVSAATVSSLPRFAKLGRAKVLPVVTRMTHLGYEVQVMKAWQDFPTNDVVTDTAQMNVRLQSYIEAMPEQYYWVHQRFKSRPVGEASFYK